MPGQQRRKVKAERLDHSRAKAGFDASMLGAQLMIYHALCEAAETTPNKVDSLDAAIKVNESAKVMASDFWDAAVQQIGNGNPPTQEQVREFELSVLKWCVKTREATSMEPA